MGEAPQLIYKWQKDLKGKQNQGAQAADLVQSFPLFN